MNNLYTYVPLPIAAHTIPYYNSIPYMENHWKRKFSRFYQQLRKLYLQSTLGYET